MSARTAPAEETYPIEVHEWSVWIADSTQAQINGQRSYPSALPGIAESSRTQSSAGAGAKLAPISMLTVHGKPSPNFEVEARLNAGRWLGHWPSAELKGNRLRWLDLSLVEQAPADTQLGYVSQDHWFQRARAVKSLLIRKGTRLEQFLASDVELTMPVPIALKGGPDVYQIENKTNRQLFDILISMPAPGGGRRIGWLDTLPPAGQAAARNAAVPQRAGSTPNANVPLQSTVVGTTRTALNTNIVANVPPAALPPAAVKVAVNSDAGRIGSVAVDPTPAAATVGTAKPGTATTVTATPTPAATGGTIVMSEVLSPSGAEFRRLTDEALQQRLVKTGLAADEAGVLSERYHDAFFSSEKLLAVVRLPQATLDEQIPLTFYPEPKRVVRTALLVVRNIDPGVGKEVSSLIAQLADPRYSTREAAQKRLTELGALAQKAIKEAVKHADPEVATRAEQILIDQGQSPGQ